MMHAQPVDQPAGQPPPAPATKGRGAGRPFPKGVSPNPGGRPKVEEPDPGVVTAALMRAVLGQSKGADAGPTEKLLRRWLDKDPKGYLETIDKKAKAEGEEAGARAENAGLKAEVERLRERVAELE